MAQESKQDFRQYESERLALLAKLSKKARITALACTFLPLCFAFLNLVWNNNSESIIFGMVSVTLILIITAVSSIVDGYIRTQQTALDRVGRD